MIILQVAACGEKPGDMVDYEKLTRLLFESATVKRFNTFVSMGTVKANSEVMVWQHP